MKKNRLKWIIGMVIIMVIVLNGIKKEAPGDITVFDDCDSCNAGNVISIVGNTISMEQIYEYESAETGWFNFRLTNVLGKTVTFKINAPSGEVGDISSSGTNLCDGRIYKPKQMVYTCDVGLPPLQQTWKYFGKGSDGNSGDTISYSSPVYSVTHTYECNEVQIASYYAYSYTDAMNYIDSIVTRTESMPNAEANVKILGNAEPLKRSKGNYTVGQILPVKMLDLTNPNTDDNNKRHIFIIGRQHPAETQATWMTMGLIEMILNNQFYLDNFHWYWVPIVEVTGVVDGNSRWICFTGSCDISNSAYWYNSNRQWGRTCATSQVKAVQTEKNSLNSEYGIDFFIDWHGWAAGRDASNSLGEPINTYSYEYAKSYGLSDFDAHVMAFGGQDWVKDYYICS